jgi:hypothetical protein
VPSGACVFFQLPCSGFAVTAVSRIVMGEEQFGDTVINLENTKAHSAERFAIETFARCDAGRKQNGQAPANRSGLLLFRSFRTVGRLYAT